MQGMGSQGQAGQGTMDKTRQMQRDRLRTQATDQQRQQFKTCDQSQDRIRTQARDMARAASGSSFNADQARQQRDQLREQLQTMEQQHESVMQGLNSQQRSAVEQRTRTMQLTQQRINNRLRNMDQELAKGSPDGKRVAEQASNVEREMNEYQKQYRETGDDLSLRNQ
jgi:hypothetical protein